jgi:hypothetical protein
VGVLVWVLVGGLQGGVEGVGHDFCGWFVRFVVVVSEKVCVLRFMVVGLVVVFR